VTVKRITWPGQRYTTELKLQLNIRTSSSQHCQLNRSHQCCLAGLVCRINLIIGECDYYLCVVRSTLWNILNSVQPNVSVSVLVTLYTCTVTVYIVNCRQKNYSSRVCTPLPSWVQSWWVFWRQGWVSECRTGRMPNGFSGGMPNAGGPNAEKKWIYANHLCDNNLMYFAVIQKFARHYFVSQMTIWTTRSWTLWWIVIHIG